MLLRIIFFLLISSTLHAQTTNLVINGDFEEYSACPKDYVKVGSHHTCTDWRSYNNGTPDYFNKCSSLAGVPENFAGIRAAYSGVGYCGIVAGVFKSQYEEYLQGTLIDTLEKGKKYILTIHICWAQNSSYMISNLGIKFQDTKNGGDTDLLIMFPLHNYYDWETFTDTITARGTEKHILIGSFQSGQKFVKNFNKRIALNDDRLLDAAYYYIDQVSVKELKDPAEPDFPVGEYFVGEGIYFELDKYNLSDSSSLYLKEVAQFLKNHPQRKIKIEGHTDKYGTKEYNLMLSEKRAEEVKMYLISKGVEESRITTKGWGYEYPLADQDHLQYLNRRIELFIE